jgi:hypothetical protein
VRTLILVFACCVLSLPCLGQTNDNVEWGEKFNSPGATMVVKELGRARLNGQTMVTYHAFVSGLPKDVEYTVWWKLPGTKPQSVADAYINKEGLVVNVLADPANNVAEDPIDLQVFAGRGELKQFALISNDAKYRVFAQVVPFPISKTSGACSISATMMSQDYHGVMMVVTGLEPKEEFRVNESSGNEAGDTKAVATDKGTYTTLVFPIVKGMSSGTLRYAVTAKTCSVDIEVPWGRGSYVIQ